MATRPGLVRPVASTAAETRQPARTMFAANRRVRTPGVTSAAATPYIPWRSAHSPMAIASSSVGTR